MAVTTVEPDTEAEPVEEEVAAVNPLADLDDVALADAVIDAIYHGRLDNAFDDTLNALKQRLKAANAHVTWKFTWDGRTIEKRKLPLKVCRLFETLSGLPYTMMHPGSATMARHIIAALLIADGVDTRIAVERADEANGWEIAESIVEEAVPGGPFGGPRSLS